MPTFLKKGKKAILVKSFFIYKVKPFFYVCFSEYNIF